MTSRKEAIEILRSYANDYAAGTAFREAVEIAVGAIEFEDTIKAIVFPDKKD